MDKTKDLLRRSRNLLSHPPLWWKDNEASREKLIAELDAALAESDLDWSLLEATQESLREHMAEIHRLRAALTKPQRKPLTEYEIEQAHRHIYRRLPYEFDHSTPSWVEQGIRYAERAHGIGGSDA